MTRPPETWYRNPFRLGSVGLIALLGGYAILASSTVGGETSSLVLTGRLIFLLGVGTVLTAGVRWFLDARAPEPAQDEDEELAE